ncbi:MAG: fibronectin type III domain-containing protein [Thermoguttaceae bacterium]|nr:fibronectin type III domain-containing protein [Thermoguttaceae bacterium]
MPKYRICRVDFLEERALLSASPYNTLNSTLDAPEDEPLFVMTADCLASPSPVEALTENVLAYSESLAASPANRAEDAPGKNSNSDIMIGNVFVRVVLLESNGQTDASTENWTSDRIRTVKNEISEGLQWWEDTFDNYYPDSPIDLNFQIDFTYADSPFQTSYEPINHPHTDDYRWVSEFLVSQGYAGGASRSAVNTSLGNYNYAMRLANDCDWAYTIFIADSFVDPDGKFTDSYFGYAWIGGPRLQLTYDNNGWGINDMSIVVAHETGHIFCALDEYDVGSSYSSGSASWQETGGYYGVQNLNAWDSPYGQTDSIMAGSSLQHKAWNKHISSESSLQMIGWRDSDGDGLIDYLDQPLTLTNANGLWNDETGIFCFTGQSTVTCMRNRRTGYNHTLNTVDVLQYQLDDGEWQTAQTWSNTSRVDLNAALDFSSLEGVHTITFQTLCTRTGVTSDEVSFTFGSYPLATPTLEVSPNGSNAVTVTVSEVEDATGYALQFSTSEDFSNAVTMNVTAGSTTLHGLTANTTYYFRVRATGEGFFRNSDFSLTQTVKTDEPDAAEITINGRKVTVSWVDENSTADMVRYRVAGTERWTVKKLRAGVMEFTFNAAVGTNYEIEVLLDQQEVNVLQATAVVLDQPKLSADRNAIRDDSFEVNVTNFTAKNLAANATQAILTVNGVQTVLNLVEQQGAGALTNGGNVTFADGRFTFTGMSSNTQYKVQVSFSDGLSVSTPSAALSVRTLKTPYLAPEITSATAVSDSAIVVTWETAKGKNSDAEAQKYTVQYSLDGVKWTNATTGATGNSFTIQRLKGGNEYQVRVLASKDGAFEASVPSDVMTAETLALPKLALERNSVTDDAFTVSVTNFQTTNLTGAAVVNVTSNQFGTAVIDLQTGAVLTGFTNEMTVSFADGALTFANVPANTQQKIQVSFTLDACTTALSQALTVKTTLAAYCKPTVMNAFAVSATSVTVEWETVYGKNSTIEAQRYTVQYSTDGVHWTTATTAATGTTFTITRLKPGTQYQVAVLATKDARFNASKLSDPWTVTTAV